MALPCHYMVIQTKNKVITVITMTTTGDVITPGGVSTVTNMLTMPLYILAGEFHNIFEKIKQAQAGRHSKAIWLHTKIPRISTEMSVKQ